MVIENIQNHLRRLGYYIYTKGNNKDIIYGGIKEDYKEGLIDSVLNNCFKIEVKDNIIKIEMGSLVIKKEEFNNEKDLIDFVKENAPIK